MQATSATPSSRCTLHATAIAVGSRAALIVGPSGAGKSDLALRVVTGSFRDCGRVLEAALVADDQVLLERTPGALVARPPPSIAGRLEVRGIGIVEVAHVAAADVCLIVDVEPGAPIERLPDPPETRHVLGVLLPCIRLRPFEASAPAKLVLALARLDAAAGVAVGDGPAARFPSLDMGRHRG